MHELYEEINEKEDSSDDFAVNAEKTDITGILPASDQMPASDAVIRINKSEPDTSKLDTVVLHSEEQKKNQQTVFLLKNQIQGINCPLEGWLRDFC